MYKAHVQTADKCMRARFPLVCVGGGWGALLEYFLNLSM